MKCKRYLANAASYLVLLAVVVVPLRGFGQISSYWHLNEVFSSVDGAVQFIELSTTPSTPQTLAAYYLYNDRGQSFFFQMSYPGGSGNQTFLIATRVLEICRGRSRLISDTCPRAFFHLAPVLSACSHTLCHSIAAICLGSSYTPTASVRSGRSV